MEAMREARRIGYGEGDVRFYGRRRYSREARKRKPPIVSKEARLLSEMAQN